MVKIVNIFLILIFSLSFYGCGEKAPRKLYFRDKINLLPEVNSALGLMAQELNDAAGREIISLQSGNKPISIRMTSSDNLSNSDTLAHARYLEYHCLIEIRDDIEDVVRQQISPFAPNSVSDAQVEEGLAFILMHELGHCFGLDHSDDPDSLMYPDFQNSWNQQTIDDLAEILSKISE